MKTLTKLTLVLALAVACFAQGPINFTATPQTPVPTSVTQSGALGTTSYYYWIVAIYAGGNSGPAGPIGTNYSNATLSSTNYNIVSFAAPSSPLSAVTGYDILRTTTTTAPTGACACAVATNQASSPVNDQSNTLSAYTVTTKFDTALISLDNSTASTAVLNITKGITSSGGVTAAGLSITGNGAVTGTFVPTGGIQQSSTAEVYSFFSTLNLPNGLVAPASTTGGGTGKTYISQIFIPTRAALTGACWVNGATVGADKHLAVLWDKTGAVVANSALAGATTAGASGLQCVAFTAQYAAVGPQTYYIGIQTNGSTDNFFTYTTAGAPTGYGTTLANQTFGTMASITPPTTFTTAQGPLMMTF